ncbi:IFT80, partial [Symbiodinium pilosum]
TIYDIIAHAKFANDVSEKAGQRMYRVVHANLSLFSTRQQKFLEKECALAKQQPVRSRMQYCG